MISIRALAMTALLALAVPVAMAGDDPLAPARAGKIACAAPHAERKTCRAMTRYRFDNGRIFDTTELALSESPLDISTVSTEATVHGPRICEVWHLKDIEAGQVTRDGVALTGSDATTAMSVLSDFASQNEGRTVCTDAAPYGSRTYTVQTFYDGVQHPQETYYMIWVSPDEGYTVGY